MKDNNAVGFLFERTTRQIKLRFHQLFKSLGVQITPEQWVVLDILFEKGKVNQKDLANYSFKDAPSVSRIVQGLIAKGFIIKKENKHDRRISDLKLTLEGTALVKKLIPEVKELRKIGIEGLQQQELEIMKELMNKIFANYSKI